MTMNLDEAERRDGCNCQYDAAGRRFRSRCICPPPMTPEELLRGVAGLGGGIGDAVADVLAERDRLRAALAEAQAKAATLREQRDWARQENDDLRAALAEAQAENERLRAALRAMARRAGYWRRTAKGFGWEMEPYEVPEPCPVPTGTIVRDTGLCSWHLRRELDRLRALATAPATDTPGVRGDMGVDAFRDGAQ
jgi:hypothetical protein